MKYTCGFLLLIFAITSCQEVKDKTSKKAEIVSLENDSALIVASSTDDSNITLDTTKPQSSTSDVIDSILPTPDDKFMSGLDSSLINNAEYVIKKYIETYFVVTKEKEVIEKASINHPEIPGKDCKYRTEYTCFNITEDYGCESYEQTTTIEFTHYTFQEVKRVIKILLPKVANYEIEDSYYEGWDNDDRHYSYEDYCGLDIFKMENKILVEYGCGN